MNKTKIPWCDYTANPVKGLCPMACSYCYARRLYKRFGWDETVRIDEDEIYGNRDGRIEGKVETTSPKISSECSGQDKRLRS